MTAYGPLFSSESQVNGMLHEIETEVAQRGFQLVHANLASSLKHPTGYYQGRIQVTRDPPGMTVNDDRVVYGSWLESGEYTPRRRFKGYGSFRRAAQQLDREAVRIAMPIVAQFVRAVN